MEEKRPTCSCAALKPPSPSPRTQTAGHGGTLERRGAACAPAGAPGHRRLCAVETGYGPARARYARRGWYTGACKRSGARRRARPAPLYAGPAYSLGLLCPAGRGLQPRKNKCAKKSACSVRGGAYVVQRAAAPQPRKVPSLLTTNRPAPGAAPTCHHGGPGGMLTRQPPGRAAHGKPPTPQGAPPARGARRRPVRPGQRAPGGPRADPRSAARARCGRRAPGASPGPAAPPAPGPRPPRPTPRSHARG